MKKTIIIYPVTRISEFLEITAEAIDNIVTNAKTSGMLFRGVDPGVMVDGTRYTLDPPKITENIHSSWYKSDAPLQVPGAETIQEVDLNNVDGYSFIKAPRYNGLPIEGGPLARLMIFKIRFSELVLLI
jgi:Ni,Fe-hydrogenase I large subunit